MADGSRKVKKKSSSAKKSSENENTVKKKQLEAAIRSQVAAEEKAHRIVEQLVLENVSEDHFLEIGNYITPSHYADITEERALAKMCGYPLCTNTMPQILKQKYKISVQTNRVFDITERKCFCSNHCFKASKFYESQIQTSPVWTRRDEEPKKFTLLKQSSDSSRLGSGELLIGRTHLQSNPSEDMDTQTNEPENDHEDKYLTYRFNDLSISSNSRKQISKERENGTTCGANNLKWDSHNECNTNLTAETDTDCKNAQKLIPKKDKDISSEKLKLNDERTCGGKDVFLDFIKKTLKQWFTVSTHKYFNLTSTSGCEDTIKEGPHSEDIPNFTERALDFLRLNRSTDDSKVDDDDDNTAGQKDMISAEDIAVKERDDFNKDFACIVPPIDSKSQLTIRRQIVLQKLITTLPEMLANTQYNTREVENHFSELVKTFRLNNQNVMFKPLEWKGLAASLLYLIHTNLYSNVIGLPNVMETMATTLKHLELTEQNMIDISNTLIDSLQIDDKSDCQVTSPVSAESYSLMEELD